jgi:uncharacterized protein (TIGR03067 family)
VRVSACGLMVAGVLLAGMVAVVTAEETREAAIKQDLQQLQGTWRAVQLVLDGQLVAESEVRKLTVVNGSDGSWTLRVEENDIGGGTSTIDPGQTPKTIDLTVTKGDGKGDQYVGIYEMGEKTRKLCFVQKGNERPTELTSTPGSERILVTFQRESDE